MKAERIAEELGNSSIGNPHEIGEWVDVRKEMPKEIGQRFNVLIRNAQGETRQAVYGTLYLQKLNKIQFFPTDRRGLEGQWEVIKWRRV